MILSLLLVSSRIKCRFLPLKFSSSLMFLLSTFLARVLWFEQLIACATFRPQLPPSFLTVRDLSAQNTFSIPKISVFAAGPRVFPIAPQRQQCRRSLQQQEEGDEGFSIEPSDVSGWQKENGSRALLDRLQLARDYYSSQSPFRPASTCPRLVQSRSNRGLR